MESEQTEQLQDSLPLLIYLYHLVSVAPPPLHLQDIRYVCGACLNSTSYFLLHMVYI